MTHDGIGKYGCAGARHHREVYPISGCAIDRDHHIAGRRCGLSLLPFDIWVLRFDFLLPLRRVAVLAGKMRSLATAIRLLPVPTRRDAQESLGLIVPC